MARSRLVLSSFAVLAAVSLAFVLPTPSSAQAAADVAPPAYVSSHVTPVTADVTSAPATITAAVRLTDATGVSSVAISIRHEQSGQSYLSSARLSSGTSQNGVWSGTFRLPQGSAGGAWTITLYPASDTLGNSMQGFRTIRTVQITSGVTDVAPPVYVSAHVTPLSVDVSKASAHITAAVRLTDATAVEGATMSIRHVSSGQSYMSSARLASGTPQNGVWSGTFTLPRGAAAGTWTISLYPARDTLGNQMRRFTDIRNVQVASAVAVDTAPPVYVSAHVTPTSVNVVNGSATVAAAVRLTDQTGVADVTLSIRHGATGQSYLQSARLASGTAQNGVWQASFQIPKGAAPGAWTVTLYPARDTLGNDMRGFSDVRTVQVTSSTAAR